MPAFSTLHVSATISLGRSRRSRARRALRKPPSASAGPSSADCLSPSGALAETYSFPTGWGRKVRSCRDHVASFQQNGFDGEAALRAALDWKTREERAQQQRCEHQDRPRTFAQTPTPAPKTPARSSTPPRPSALGCLRAPGGSPRASDQRGCAGRLSWLASPWTPQKPASASAMMPCARPVLGWGGVAARTKWRSKRLTG